MTLRAMAVESFAPMLRTLSALLDKGAERAAERGFDPSVLFNARLAPDMFPLSMQIEIACNQASEGVARLIGKPQAVRGDNNDKTIDDLKARIAKTIAAVESAPAAAFDGAESREIIITPPTNAFDFVFNGEEFLRDWALPNFYFHITTAYNILRHNGVDLGKRDYLAHTGKYVRKR